MRRILYFTVLLLALVGGGIYGVWGAFYWADLEARKARLEQAETQCGCHVPVPNNRGPDVPEGFHGDVHPLLSRHTNMEVKASWECEKIPVRYLLPGMPADLDDVRRLFLGVHVAEPSKTYSERDFSLFLPPDTITMPGQLWALDHERVVGFLRQFHPVVSAHCTSAGRRAGPDGAFAVLQATSPAYLDILFRIHAEFDLAPKTSDFPARNVWYTPACFLGRIVVNRTAGTVEYFQLGVPTDESRNIHGTILTAPDSDHPEGYRIYQFLRAERMELVGGSLQGLEGAHWTKQIETAQARDQLAQVFYTFKKIHFLPFAQALATARAQKKPIFAFVALGALDDQSC